MMKIVQKISDAMVVLDWDGSGAVAPILGMHLFVRARSSTPDTSSRDLLKENEVFHPTPRR